MSDFTIEQLEALKEGTTPGPWEWHNNVYDPDERFLHSHNGSMCLSVDDVGSSYFEGDPILMAAAPALVDALIAEKRAHAKLLRKLDEMLSWWGKSSEKLSARGMEELAEVSRRRTAQVAQILEATDE